MKSVKFPTLYKITSVGKVQEWDIEVQGNVITIVYGQQDGAKVTKVDTILQGKNIGKANETSKEQQALLEAQARWNKQKDRKGYAESVAAVNIINECIDRPMLAKNFKDYHEDIKFPCYVQRKYNGNRCLYQNGELVSRSLKKFTNLQHVLAKLDTSAKLDGELYIHGVPVTTLHGYCTKLQPETLNVEYHIYDTITDGGFEDRWYKLDLKPNDTIKLVETIEVYDMDELLSYFNQFLDEGYEGAIIRSADGKYKKGGRSKDLLKLKEYMEDEFLIVGMTENDKMPGTGVFNMVTKDGLDFDAMPEGSQAERELLWKNRAKYVGKMGTVKYYEVSSKGKPFHPVFLRVKGEMEL